MRMQTNTAEPGTLSLESANQKPCFTDLGQFIKISAESIGALRKVDVFRVISSLRSDNIDGATRNDLATFIAAMRPDLVAEVEDVMREEYPQDGWTVDCEKARQSPVIKLADGYNGHTIAFFSDPIEVDGGAVKLRCAEPGKEYMTAWRAMAEVTAALAAQGGNR